MLINQKKSFPNFSKEEAGSAAARPSVETLKFNRAYSVRSVQTWLHFSIFIAVIVVGALKSLVLVRSLFVSTMVCGRWPGEQTENNVNWSFYVCRYLSHITSIPATLST